MFIALVIPDQNSGVISNKYFRMYISFPGSHGRGAPGISTHSKPSVDEPELKKYSRCSIFKEKQSDFCEAVGRKKWGPYWEEEVRDLGGQ